jgi:aerobic carbon-monoxide dehydrogenase small subunit
MKNRMSVSLTVNGERVERVVPVRLNLVDFLRNELGFTGAHVGCEHGVCGACTVRVNGRPVRGCLMLAVQADGATVETIEGLQGTGAAAALQDAFIAHNALQCGYCTPGMLITALDYLEEGGTADRAAIRERISGNYCRCTGYQSIVDAIAEIAEAQANGGGS